MRPSSVSRRAFLNSLAGGMAVSAFGLPRQSAASGMVGRSTPFGRVQQPPSGPNDQIVLGMIGVGTQGMSRLREFLKHPDTRIGAICDVDREHADRAAAEVEKARGSKPKIVGDFRHVLEDRDIDAVVVVTPDHWHSLPTVRAFEAGKDVFVEKPLSYTVAEGRMMADASSKFARVTQMGNHIHNDYPNYRRVVEIVQSGKLGRITRAHCWKTSPTESLPRTPPPYPVPTTLDYDFWLGPAPKRPYHPLRSHRSFRHFWDYSGGTFIDFWCHIVDVAVWSLNLEAPRSVAAIGGRFFVNDETETPDTIEALLEYPNLLLTFSFRPTPLPGFEHMGHIGCLFEGTDASLVTNYTTHEVWVRGKKAEDFPRPDPSIPDSPGHSREFLDAIKTRNLDTTCNVRYGHRVTKPGLLANIAFRTGRGLVWDDKKERFVRDSDADHYLRRRFRKDYKL
jgi:predicted dehydrogenase